MATVRTFVLPLTLYLPKIVGIFNCLSLFLYSLIGLEVSLDLFCRVWSKKSEQKAIPATVSQVEKGLAVSE
jgi:hypothetical protein